MNDYEVTERRPRECEVKKIPGQTIELCVDIAVADSLGISYGVYMGMKRDQEVQQFYDKFGIRLKRRRRK